MKLSQKERQAEGLSPLVMVGTLMVLAFFVRTLAAASFFEYLDLGTWNIPWASGLKEGLFTAYARIDNLDYPPVLPAFLAVIGRIIDMPVIAQSESLTMFWIKLVPILFDVANVAVIFFAAKRISDTLAVFLAATWALNPSILFNVSYWGQSDSMLIFFLALTFLYLEGDRPIIAGVFYALACLTKLQAAYYVFVFLLCLFQKYGSKKTVQVLAAGACVGLAGWLPFMIGAKEPALPLRIYFGGFGSYPYINLHAFNLFGIGDNNFVTENKALLGGVFDPQFGFAVGGFTYAHLGTILTGAIFAGLIGIYVYGIWRKKQIGAYPMAMLLGNLIFVLTTRQHERYQVPVMIFCLLSFIYFQKKAYFQLYLGVTILSLLNQTMLIFSYQFGEPYESARLGVQAMGSVLNLVLAIYMIVVVVQSLRLPREEPLPA